MVFIVLLVLFFVGTLCEPNIPIIINGIKCAADELYAKDVICEIKPVPGKPGLGHFGITFIEPFNDITATFHTYILKGPNEQERGPITFIENFCTSLASSESFLFTLLPFLLEMIRPIQHDCPYLPGRLELDDFELPSTYINEQIIMPFYNSGEYRASLRFFDHSNITIFEITADFYLNNDQLAEEDKAGQ